jgi:hypothetical protein
MIWSVSIDARSSAATGPDTTRTALTPPAP